MDEKQQPNGQQVFEDSSLETSETEVQSAQQVVQPSDTQQQPLEFVGYQPPQEPRWKQFARAHKIPLVVGAFLLVIGSTTAAIALLGGSAEDPSPVQQNTKVVEETESTDTPEEELVVPVTALAGYALRQDGDFYKLVAGGKSWLERTESSWDETVLWNDWLFFGTNASDKDHASFTSGSNYQSVHIDGFNLSTQRYVTVDALTPPAFTYLERMHVYGNKLYITFNGAGTSGVTYQCSLSEESGCSDMKLIYDQAGQLVFLSEQPRYVFDVTADAGTLAVVFKKFGSSEQIVNVSSNGRIGSEIVCIGSDGLIWIIETVDVGDGKPQLKQLYAVDDTGATKNVLPAESFPIIGALPAQVVFAHDFSDQIVFKNAEKQVTFDASNKEFKPVEDAQPDTDMPTGATAIAERLKLPENYSIKQIITNADR